MSIVAHLYRIDNLKTSEYYIGKHNGFDQTRPDGRLYWGSGKRIKRQIKKYGVENFKYNILVIGDSKYIYDLEKRMVTPQLLQDELCLNLDIGGEGSHFQSAETRKKLKENAGVKMFTEEQRKQISENLKRHYKNNPDTIKRQTEKRLKTISQPEVKNKISENRKKLWQNPEYRKKCVESHLGKSPWNKGVPMKEEVKERMTAWAKEHWKDKPGFFAGKKHDDATKEKMSFAQKKKAEAGIGLTTGYKAINDGTNIKYVPPNELQSYLDAGWNKGSIGKPKSPESIKKQADKIRGRKATDEQRKNLSIGQKRSYELNPERKQNHSKKMKGRVISDEHKKKISESSIGKKMSIEAIQKLKDIRAKQVFPEGHYEKIGKILSQLKWVNNGQKNRRVKPEMLDELLNNGWFLGKINNINKELKEI